MVDIQSKEIIDKMSEDLKVQPAMQLPRELGKQILPVFNVNANKIINVVERTSSASSGTSTIMTTDLNRDFFLTDVWVSGTADVTADNVSYVLAFTPRGKASISVRLLKQTTTAGDHQLHLDFNFPLLLDRGSVITIASAFTVGASTREATAFGFTTDPQ